MDVFDSKKRDPLGSETKFGERASAGHSSELINIGRERTVHLWAEEEASDDAVLYDFGDARSTGAPP
jgi:hypothetical protein